jgi:hypothetical protein
MLRVSPATILDPRLAFVAFVLVFFGPWFPLMEADEVVIVLCGALYFLTGSLLPGKSRQIRWPDCRPRYGLVLAILGYKAFALAHSLGFDFSLEAIVAMLIQSSIAQKENVAASIVINALVSLLLWSCLIGICQRGRLAVAIVVLLVYQVLSLQTGRFLLVSQIGLLLVVHHQIHRRTFNGALLAALLVALALSFPFLHAVRTGEMTSGNADIYSADYVRGIMSADASPGLNFLDLVRHVEDQGVDHGRFVLLAPAQFVPRALWAEKPTTSQQAHYTYQIFGLDHLDGVSFTFTIFDSYAWFGLASLAAACLLWGALFTKLYRGFLGSKSLYLRIQLGLLTVNAFNFYRGSVLDFAAPIVLSLFIAWGLDRLGLLRASTPRQRRLPAVWQQLSEGAVK